MTGVDVSQHVVDTINRGEIHIEEVDLDAIRANTTFRSKSFSVVSATLTSTKSVTSGAGYQLSIRAFPDMRS